MTVFSHHSMSPLNILLPQKMMTLYLPFEQRSGSRKEKEHKKKEYKKRLPYWLSK